MDIPRSIGIMICCKTGRNESEYVAAGWCFTMGFSVKFLRLLCSQELRNPFRKYPASNTSW